MKIMCFSLFFYIVLFLFEILIFIHVIIDFFIYLYNLHNYLFIPLILSYTNTFLATKINYKFSST